MQKIFQSLFIMALGFQLSVSGIYLASSAFSEFITYFGWHLKFHFPVLPITCWWNKCWRKRIYLSISRSASLRCMDLPLQFSCFVIFLGVCFLALCSLYCPSGDKVQRVCFFASFGLQNHHRIKQARDSTLVFVAYESSNVVTNIVAIWALKCDKIYDWRFCFAIGILQQLVSWSTFHKHEKSVFWKHNFIKNWKRRKLTIMRSRMGLYLKWGKFLWQALPPSGD